MSGVRGIGEYFAQDFWVGGCLVQKTMRLTDCGIEITEVITFDICATERKLKDTHRANTC
jgi:hypothetical protein